jgi:hypothetical protein
MNPTPKPLSEPYVNLSIHTACPAFLQGLLMTGNVLSTMPPVF